MTREERMKFNYDKCHKIINEILYKKCTLHNEFFSEENNWFPCTDEYFYKNKTNKQDGLSPWCKKCATKKELDNRDPEYHNKTTNFYYHNNPKDQQIKKRSSNNRRINGKHKEWQRNNPDKTASYNKKRQRKNHNITEREWESCKEYFNYQCAYCGLTEQQNKELYGQQLHKEHITNEGSNGLDNCTPSCKSCNSSKHTDDMNNWYNSENTRFDINKYEKIILWANEDYKKYSKMK